ncbi:MAG: YaiO family outer membrane beta-barrel protein [Bacteroidales bacterium]|nr:YaiO family outer membrane beta-barrel protein [Bacteroidales bacterium]
MIRRWFIFVIAVSGIFLAQRGTAQSGINLSVLYNLAQKEASQGNYDSARLHCEIILKTDKNNTGAMVLLGRIYSWQKNYTKAKEVLKQVLALHPKNYDALLAYTDVLWWQGENPVALKQVNEALLYYSKNEALLYKKARILLSLKKEKEAQSVLSRVLELNPKDTSARELLGQVKKASVYNTISWETSFEYFNRPYTNRWYLNNLSYRRKTSSGPVIADFYLADVVQNQEHLFSKGTDKLFEFSAYPVIGKKNYVYVSYGFGGTQLLPRQRAGLEVYQKLNHAFDVSAGVRFMQFRVNPDSLLNLWILTASVDKYYRNYWFMIRTYLTPRTSGWDKSFVFSVRRYFNTADNFVNLDFGLGNSINRLNDYVAPLEVYHQNMVNILFTGQYRISTSWTVKGTVGLKNAEYTPQKYRNAFYSSVRLSYSF